MNRPEQLGILLLGVVAVGMGLRTIRRREEVAIDEIGTVIATYRGPAAFCRGVSAVLTGLGIVAAALAGLLGLGAGMETQLRGRPGALISFASLAGLAWSLSLVFGSVEQRGSTLRLVAGAPGRLLGVVLTTVSVAGLGLGVWEMVAPAQFDHFIALLSNGPR
jgi:hypothetical protein